MLIVERTKQLSDCASLLAETESGQGRVALIEGLMATGRTELLRSVTEKAREAGFCVLSATCSSAEKTLSFGVVNQLWHGASPAAPVSERVAGLLAGGVARVRHGMAEPSGANLVQAHHELVLALLDLAVQTPVLVTVDDLRHADTESLCCLLNLIRRSASSRIMIVVTDDVADDATHLSFRAGLLQQPHAHRIRVGPLSPAGVTDVVTRRFGAAPSARLSAECYAASGGNPALLRALLDDHAAGDGPTARGYGLAMVSALQYREPIMGETVRGLAVLGDDASGDEVAELIGANAEPVRRALDTLNGAGLLDNGRLRHEAARSAVLAGLSAVERAELHWRAARLLHDRGAPATRVARHLVRADDVTAAWAAPVLVEAAGLVLLDNDAASATRFLEAALALTTGARERAAIMAKLADAEWSVNPGTATRHVVGLTAAARAGALDRDRWPALVRQLLWHGRTDDAADLMRLLRNDPGPAGGTRDLETWLAYAHPTLARPPGGPTVPSPAGPPGADPWLRAAGELAGALARGQDDTAVARAEEVLRDLRLGRDTAWTDEAILLALLAFVYADRTAKALEWHDRLSAGLGGRTDGVRGALLTAVRAEIAVRDGDLATGLRHATAALRLLPARSWGVAVGLPLGSLILAATRMGRYAEAAKYLTCAIPDGMFGSRYGLGYLLARGHYHLATNHVHAALADFRSCGELMRDWGLDVAGLVPWRTSAAEAWLRLGNADQARLLIFDQLGRPGVDGTRIRGTALWMLAQVSPQGRRLSLCTEALELLERSGDRFGQARVLADLSHACDAARQKRRARLLLRQALHVANMCGAQPLATELFAVSGETVDDAADIRPNGIAAMGAKIGELSSSERRVASLAVMGYTNREIAARLYVTPSTVEQHLTRVYRKLDVKRRKDLPVGLRAELTKTV